MTPVIQSFLRAASNGDVNRVRGLLAQGTNVDSVNRAGQTALMLAAGFRRHDVVRVLVAANANLEIQDELGLTAIDWANNDSDIITLLNQVKPESPEPKPSEVPQRSDDFNPIPRTTRNTQPPIQRPNDESSLTGLAGAILRDHKPRLEEHVQAVGPPIQIFNREPENVEPPPEDETLDKPLQTLTEDTAAPRSSARSSSRIFDLGAAVETSKPLSKVEVTVPEAPRRSYAFVWLLMLVALAGAGFGSYRLVKSLLLSNAPPPVATPASKPEATPSKTTAKAPPAVSGELAGAELHLPDAIYPTEAQGKSGTVRVEVEVSAKGIVFGARTIEGDEVFREAAEKAAKGSAFSPDKLADKTKVIEGVITYTFAPQSTAPGVTTSHGVTAVAGGPLTGTELNLVQPDYPSDAKLSGAIGEFTVVVRVNRGGRVMSWRPLDGDNRLRESVVNAARRSTFSPSKLPGTGDVVGTITYTFN